MCSLPECSPAKVRIGVRARITERRALRKTARYGVQLTAILAATLLLLLAPAYALYGTVGVQSAIWAVGLCLLVGWTILHVSQRLSAAGMDLAATFAAMGLRMGLVLAVALAICYSRPDIREGGFLWWLAVAYLATLAIETRQLLDTSGSKSSVGKAVSSPS